MATSTRHNESRDLDTEARLRRYALAAPPAALRGAVLDRVRVPARPPRSEVALGWALAMLVVVQIWGGWMERGTAARMARLGAPSGVSDSFQEPGRPNGWLESATYRVELAVLHPRYTLPLGPGVHTTRFDSGRIPILSLSAGESSWPILKSLFRDG